eukprot:SAG22_NODE_9521_length_585_cov_1.030864_1_plen_54_part_01
MDSTLLATAAATCRLAYSNLPPGITAFVLQWAVLGLACALAAVLAYPLARVLRA